MSFTRHREEDELPLVELGETGEESGGPDAISEGEMMGLRKQIMRYSQNMEDSPQMLVGTKTAK